MGFIERVDKNISKLGKRISKEESKIAILNKKFEEKKITKAKLNLEHNKINEKIKALKTRIQTLKGIIVKEKQHQEKKEEDRKKKEEKKIKKKEEKKK